MKTKFVEATQNLEHGPNYGKFFVGLPDEEEWARPSEMDPPTTMLAGRGWSRRHVLVMDLQTGEGAFFLLGGSPSADLNKHKIWVCPMFEPFLAWLYEWVSDCAVRYPTFPGTWFRELPAVVELPDAPFAMSGYRRPGPPEQEGD